MIFSFLFQAEATEVMPDLSQEPLVKIPRLPQMSSREEVPHSSNGRVHLFPNDNLWQYKEEHQIMQSVW